MKVLRIAISALLALGASAAVAQDYSRPGMYGQLNGVASFESFDGVPSSVLETGLGASGRIGYRTSPQFAFEGLVEYSGDFIDIGSFDLTSTLVAANARYYVLTERAQPYLAVGAGWGFANTNAFPDESGFVVRFGGGLDYYLSESWGLTGEFAYNLATGDLDDFNYMTLGWGAFLRF
jgi:Outer membrane protein beta-barrel domain